MRVWKGVGLAGAIVLVALLVIGGMVSRVMRGDDCVSSVVGEVPSPSSHYRAILLERRCGHFSGAKAQVGIVRGTDTRLPDQPGSTLTLQGDVSQLSVYWLGDDEVTVSGVAMKTSYTVKTIQGKVVLSVKE